MTIAQIQMLTRNRQPHETPAGERYKTLDAAVAEFTSLMDRLAHAEDRAAACTCQPVPVFQITARHNAAPYRILEEIAIERMQGR